MHPTIDALKRAVADRNEGAIAALLSEDVKFLPPTYYKTWHGREPVAAVLGHVARVLSDFRYRRIMGGECDWALEFQCKVGDLDAVGADLITLDDAGLIGCFEVVMRPHRTVGALREAMNARVLSDPRFVRFRDALS